MTLLNWYLYQRNIFQLTVDPAELEKRLGVMMILWTEREPEPSNFGHLHQNYYLTG